MKFRRHRKNVFTIKIISEMIFVCFFEDFIFFVLCLNNLVWENGGEWIILDLFLGFKVKFLCVVIIFHDSSWMGSEDRISLHRIIRSKGFFANLIIWSKVFFFIRTKESSYWPTLRSDDQKSSFSVGQKVLKWFNLFWSNDQSYKNFDVPKNGTKNFLSTEKDYFLSTEIRSNNLFLNLLKCFSRIFKERRRYV